MRGIVFAGLLLAGCSGTPTTIVVVQEVTQTDGGDPSVAMTIGQPDVSADAAVAPDGAGSGIPEDAGASPMPPDSPPVSDAGADASELAIDGGQAPCGWPVMATLVGGCFVGRISSAGISGPSYQSAIFCPGDGGALGCGYTMTNYCPGTLMWSSISDAGALIGLACESTPAGP